MVRMKYLHSESEPLEMENSCGSLIRWKILAIKEIPFPSQDVTTHGLIFRLHEKFHLRSSLLPSISSRYVGFVRVLLVYLWFVCLFLFMSNPSS